MTEGLISTYEGRMILCGILAFLGVLGSIALTLATHVRKGLPLTTQTDRVTGVKEHGFFRWFVTFAAFLAGPWLLLMFAMTGTHYVLMLWHWAVANWGVLVIAAAASSLAVGAWVLRRTSRHELAVEPNALAASVPAPAVAAQPLGWSLDPNAPQWSDR